MSVFRRGDSPFFWYFFVVDGKRFTGSTGTFDRKLAEKREAIKRSDIIQGKVSDKASPITLHKLLSICLEKHWRLLDSHPTKTYHVNNLKKFFSPAKKAAEITTTDCMSYINSRLTSGRNKGTINLEIGTLSRAFNIGKKDTSISLRYNPCDDIQVEKNRKRFSEKKYQRIRFLLPEEKKAWFPLLSKYFMLMVQFASKTGMRQGEMINLQWDHLDFENSLIRVVDGKTDTPRFVPLHTDLKALLTNVEQRSTTWVFATEDGKQLSRHGFIRTEFKRTLKEAGIKNFRWHDLRHCFGSEMTMAGVGERSLADIMGHGDTRMTKRYSHLTPGFLASQIALLPSDLYYANTTQQTGNNGNTTKVIEYQ